MAMSLVMVLGMALICVLVKRFLSLFETTIPSCDWCRGPAGLHCGRCGGGSYCSKDCQKKFWKQHKLVCSCFKIQPVEGKGLGMVAISRIKTGQMILEEKSIMKINLGHSRGGNNLHWHDATKN